MTRKQYKALERAIEVFLLTILLGTIALVMLGVYAVADMVL